MKWDTSEENEEKKQPNLSRKNYSLAASIIQSSVSSELMHLVNHYGKAKFMSGPRFYWDQIHQKFTPTEPSDGLRNGNVICFQSPTWDPDRKTHREPSVREKRAAAALFPEVHGKTPMFSDVVLTLAVINSVKEMYPLEHAVIMKDPKAAMNIEQTLNYITRKCKSDGDDDANHKAFKTNTSRDKTTPGRETEKKKVYFNRTKTDKCKFYCSKHGWNTSHESKSCRASKESEISFTMMLRTISTKNTRKGVTLIDSGCTDHVNGLNQRVNTTNIRPANPKRYETADHEYLTSSQICDWTLTHRGGNGCIVRTKLYGIRMLDIPDSFISSSAAAKKGLTTTLGKEEGLIMNPQTNDVYIYSSHDKKKGVYLIDTLEDQNPSPSPSTSEAVFVENPVKTIDQLDQTKYKAEVWKPYIYTPFYPRKGNDTVTEMKGWNPIQNIQFKGKNILLEGKIRNRDGERYIKKLRNMSFFCCGCPGCQKSTLLSKMYVPDETIVLCFTNKACQNIMSILGKDAKVYTFDSKFYNEEDGTNLLSNVKRILVDECSMTPLRWMEKSNQLKTKNNCIIQFYGDPNQCKPVETHNRYIDYANRKFFREMCDNNMCHKMGRVRWKRIQNSRPLCDTKTLFCFAFFIYFCFSWSVVL